MSMVKYILTERQKTSRMISKIIILERGKMMTVLEMYEELGKQIEMGNGEIDVISVDARSSDTGSTCVGDLQEITEQMLYGRLCYEEIGYKYVPIYMDH